MMEKRFGLVMKMKIIVLAFSASCFSLVADVHAAQNNWSEVAEKIEKGLNAATSIYEKGKKDQAMEIVADAYFGIFEGEKANMEIAVRRFISLKKAAELEKGFADLRKAVKEGIASAEFKRQTSNLIASVKAAARELDRKGVGLSSEL